MNYIKRLTYFFDKSVADPNFTPTHLSLFMALFQLWNQSRFLPTIQIVRDDVIRLSKINSKATYHKAMGYLHKHRYINYEPSYNPFKGSKISFFPAETTTSAEPVQILTARPINEPNIKRNRNPIIPHNRITSSLSIDQKRKRANGTVSSSAVQPRQPEKEKSSAQKETSMVAASNARGNENGGSMRPKKNKLFSNEQGIPPQPVQVETFFLAQQSTLAEAQRFINHYTANGWLVGGKSPMKDWKASAKNWISNSINFNGHGQYSKSNRAQQLNATTVKSYIEPL